MTGKALVTAERIRVARMFFPADAIIWSLRGGGKEPLLSIRVEGTEWADRFRREEENRRNNP